LIAGHGWGVPVTVLLTSRAHFDNSTNDAGPLFSGGGGGYYFVNAGRGGRARDA
jgi:hypothetical protein